MNPKAFPPPVLGEEMPRSVVELTIPATHGDTIGCDVATLLFTVNVEASARMIPFVPTNPNCPYPLPTVNSPKAIVYPNNEESRMNGNP